MHSLEELKRMTLLRFGDNMDGHKSNQQQIVDAAVKLFDAHTQNHAWRGLWAELGEALYGADDPRVKKLRGEAVPHEPSHGGVREELRPTAEERAERSRDICGND